METPFGEGFQKAVTLLQHLVVFDQVLQIGRVELGEQRVEIAPAFLAAACNDLNVIRCNNDTGEAADMPGKFFIGLPIYREFFFAVLPQDADNGSGLAFFFEMSFYAEACRAFLYILLIGFGEIAFGKAEIVDRVQQVGLPHPVVAGNADDPFPELETGLAIVLELNERYIF